MKTQAIRLLETQYDVDTFNHNKLIITGFYDYITEELFTPEDILAMKGKIALFVNLYNPVVHYFHKLCADKGYKITTCGKQVYVNGRHPTKQYQFSAVYTSHRMDGRRKCKDCIIFKPADEDGANEIYLVDSTKWFTDFNGFNVPTDGRAKQLYDILLFAMKENNGDLKKTLASQARENIYMGIPKLIDSNDIAARKDLVQEIRSSYVSGYNYLANTKRQPFLYYCDVNSMYLYCLSAYDFPSLAKLPQYHKGFVKPNSNQLAIYHIQSIVADVKPKHFPTIFSGTMTKKELEINDEKHLNITCMKPNKGWITSIDYEMLFRDYDVSHVEIDKTYIYEKEPEHSRIHRSAKLCREYARKRDAIKGTPEYDYYKLIINSLTGSISMTNKEVYSHEDLIEKGDYAMIKENTNIPNIEISAFMTAYARRYITELALLAGYDNVHCVSTDAIVLKDYSPVKHLLGKELGQLKMDELRNARWWRINAYEWYDESGKWNTKASGVSNNSYNEGDDTACQPLLILDKEKGFYCKIYRTIKLSESIYEE